LAASIIWIHLESFHRELKKGEYIYVYSSRNMYKVSDVSYKGILADIQNVSTDITNTRNNFNMGRIFNSSNKDDIEEMKIMKSILSKVYDNNK